MTGAIGPAMAGPIPVRTAPYRHYVQIFQSVLSAVVARSPSAVSGLLTVLAAARGWHDSGRGQGRLRIDGLGESREEGRLVKYVLDHLMLRLPNLFEAFESPMPRASTGRDPVHLSHPSHSVRVGPAAQTPGRAGGDSEIAAGAGLRSRCTHRSRRDAEAVRPGPARLAGRSITKGVRMPEKIETMVTTRGV